jgi:mannose-6-phosphate isomerase-like protein (cupin superfamily)
MAPSEEQRPLVLHPGEGRVVRIGVSTVRLLTVSRDTGDRSSVEEIHVPAEFGGPPPHFHQKTNHSWYVIEGELRLSVAGESYDLTPGGFVHIPVGTSHTFANPSADEARMVEFTTPGGFDLYLDELAEAFPAGADLDPELMVEIMARHDTYLTGT